MFACVTSFCASEVHDALDFRPLLANQFSIGFSPRLYEAIRVVLRVLKSDQAIDFLVLRHSCGFSLANRGYDLRLIQFKITLGIAIPSTPFTIHGRRRTLRGALALSPFWSVGHFLPY